MKWRSTLDDYRWRFLSSGQQNQREEATSHSFADGLGAGRMGRSLENKALLIVSLQPTRLPKWLSFFSPSLTDLWLMRFVLRLVVEHKLANQWQWIRIISHTWVLLQWSVLNIQINSDTLNDSVNVTCWNLAASVASLGADEDQAEPSSF